MADWVKKLVVVSIDVGTTHSGFALSFSKDYEDDPLNIYMQLWKAGDQPRTLKTPTCLLLKPEGTFHSFGYDAEKKYALLVDDDEHRPWRFFFRFKMELYKDKGRYRGQLTKRRTITDTDGREFPAIDVFAATIKYLKDEAYTVIHERAPVIIPNDIYYVLTVPAIWSETAKSFMRAAATKAGIESSHLKIALEPECASVYVSKQKQSAISTLPAGSLYMVIDLGGGTCDIAVHRTKHDGTIEEVAIPDGGPWGSDMINANIMTFLETLIGNEAMHEFQTNDREDYTFLLRQIEQKKCAFNDEDDANVTLRLSESFRKVYEQFHEIDLSMSIKTHCKYKSLLKLMNEKLRITRDTFREFFIEVIDSIVEKVDCILSASDYGHEIQTLLLVGGFADCVLLKNAFKSRFCSKSIAVPDNALATILKGAVIFGREQSMIDSRIVRFTYGLDWNVEFDEKIHPQSKKEETDDGAVCKDIFHILVNKGERVTKTTVKPVKSFVKYQYQTEMEFPLYRTVADDTPSFVDDFGCEHVGTLTVDLTGMGTGLDRCLILKVDLGDTEIIAKATDSIGHVYKVSFSVDNL